MSYTYTRCCKMQQVPAPCPCDAIGGHFFRNHPCGVCILPPLGVSLYLGTDSPQMTTEWRGEKGHGLMHICNNLSTIMCGATVYTLNRALHAT